MARWDEGVMERQDEREIKRRKIRIFYSLSSKIIDKIRTHKDLRVYQLSFEAGMEVFELSKNFPVKEKYSLTDQVRRSSRSVSGNIAEGWRKRRYSKSFIANLRYSEGEAAETQVWLDYALSCKYINENSHQAIYDKYDHIITMLVNMVIKPEKWQF